MVGSGNEDVEVQWKNIRWQCEVEKGLKHHGWVMGHGWGSHGETWKMGTWGRNIALETLHVLVSGMFHFLGCLGIETHVKLLAKTWHVSVGGRFQVLGFEDHVQNVRFLIRWNWRHATAKTWHVYALVCLGARVAHAWKPMLGHLEANNTFTTCCWNNIGAFTPWCALSLVAWKFYS